MAKILGLDLGTNSIGWAITEQYEDRYELLDRGVDIFQEGVARTKSGEEPMVKTRTDARALRRHYFRRRLRKIELLKITFLVISEENEDTNSKKSCTLMFIVFCILFLIKIMSSIIYNSEDMKQLVFINR